jgi:hypothetical protein
MNTIKTIYTVITISVLSAAMASAATTPEPELSLKFDPAYKVGQLTVSAVNSKAAAAGIVAGDVLMQVCTVAANTAHAVKIAALAQAAGTKRSQGKNSKEVCAPVKTIADHMMVVDPFEYRGATPGWALMNMLTFKRENGQVYVTSLANTY